MERIFNDANEPFWRSAKQLELGADPARAVRRLHRAALRRHRPPDRPDASSTQILTITGGHPYATQELCYFLWEETPTAPRRDRGAPRRRARARPALRAHALQPAVGPRAGNQKLVLQALAREPGHPFAEDYRRRHGLRAASSTQKAVEALARDELVGRDRGRAWIAEPFLAEWIRANVQ